MKPPLPSWHDTPTRRAIVGFVDQVTDEGGADYLPVAQRVATFDADGTLWCEKPTQIQIAWILQRLAETAEKNPSLRSEQPYQAAFEHDDTWFVDLVTKHYHGDDSGLKALLSGITTVFGSLDVEVFAKQVTHFFDTAKHPTYDVSYREMAYLPMVELLDYLVVNGFTTYVVSGGGRDFLRPVTPQLFGIPPERVIGSAVAESYQLDDDGAHIVRGESVALIDDGPTKAVQIWDRIGRRPILAGGNANGDVAMLEYTASNDGPSLCLLVDHDDDEREVRYTAGAEDAVKTAKKNGWQIVSMEKAWSQVFSFQAPETRGT